MYLHTKYTLVFLFSFLSIICTAQGRVDGFYKGKSNLDMAFGIGAEAANDYFAGTKKIALSRVIISSNIYAAYGILDNLDIYASLPYILIGDENSIQDGSLFLKYKLFEKRSSTSSLSMSIAGGFSSNLANYQTEGKNALGQRAKILDIRPVIHYQANSGWFVTSQVAYNYKFDPVPNAIQAAFKLGKASSNYYFDLWYEFQESDGGLDYQGTPIPETFRELGVNYHKIGATYYRPIKPRLGFSVGGSYVLTGRNIGQGIGVYFGLIIKNK